MAESLGRQGSRHHRRSPVSARPAENAYSQYNELLAAALACESSALFILALGPTATVLSYALCENGRRALDLGHIDIEYEWFLRQEADVAIR